ncbi:Catenin-beta-like protein [Podospora fimiseda]|uniref:Catenin-beta-like protein n=1 Tax=Podospora fimiseda TaxID=252190 RepID=A0AAN7BME3_9PEZI|nr:Catenin-beta-like protein [Podospora fimiseda]
MTSIDEIFQKSGIPSKRKLDPIRDPNEIYKSAKLSSNSNSRHAQVEEEDDDIEAGPAPPPDDDEGDYGPAAPPEDEDGDDEEGRFFGGGITAQEKEVLDFMDDPNINNPALPDDSKIDQSWLKKTALAFEKKISRNAELRARYESDPAKFIDSEADLDAAIKSLSILSEHPDLYPLFAKFGCLASLVSLLAHENTDIAIDAIEIIGELTDEDVAASDQDWNSLVDALLEADLLGLLLSNFSRLDETQEADREGVYHSLGIIENLCSRPETTETIGSDLDLIKWLLARASKPEKPVSQNKQYSAEILAILVSSSTKNRTTLISSLDAIDSLLQLVASYRKRDPEKSSGSDEEEYLQNLFEALTSLVDEPEGKEKFLEAEGVELCLIMLKEGGKKFVKPAALKLLDRAAASNPSGSISQKIVDGGGLKPIFTTFMKKTDRFTTERMVNLFASLLRYLPADSPERIRTLAKFVEKDYEKIERLIKSRRDYAAMLAAVDAQIEQEKKTSTRAGMDEDDLVELEITWLAQRLDEGGLFTLQTIDVVLAWLIAEDDGARKKIESLLKDRDEGFGTIKATIEEQIEALDVETELGRETKEMLDALVQFL